MAAQEHTLRIRECVDKLIVSFAPKTPVTDEKLIEKMPLGRISVHPIEVPKDRSHTGKTVTAVVSDNIGNLASVIQRFQQIVALTGLARDEFASQLGVSVRPSKDLSQAAGTGIIKGLITRLPGQWTRVAK